VNLLVWKQIHSINADPYVLQKHVQKPSSTSVFCNPVCFVKNMYPPPLHVTVQNVNFYISRFLCLHVLRFFLTLVSTFSLFPFLNTSFNKQWRRQQ
jgi:hypothetical protein